MKIAGVLLLPFFFYALYVFFTYIRSSEGKSERGQNILNHSYKAALPIMPIGWLLVEVTHSFINYSFETYRDLMWILILITFIVQGFTVHTYKNKQ
ncbi:hypothetical protein [Alkalihalophilus marmarensis]|uniref:hypothetical protein n=1 Tax=Alkalihalophilus marmarensis TaxID=521377 RepID=UPI002DBAC2B8|nr:hypothetical protein [Alkalihalophilus marmarensis]MEC2072711.1 hypothetical protein [Alkalihalophilus marmarensis]